MCPTAIVLALALGTLAVAEVSTLDDAAVLARAESVFHQGVRQKAEVAVARRHFAEAAFYYGTLHERGIHNASLYHNWGNALLLSDQLAAAILAYRRGLRLAPNETGLHEQLEWARDQVQYPPEMRCRPAALEWPPWLPHLRPEWVLFAAIACYALACLGVVRWRLTGLFPGALLLALAVAGMLGFWAWSLQRQAQAGQPLGVIVRDGTVFRKGNGKSYPAQPTVPILNRGVETQVRGRRGDWLQVELVGGQTGWVRQEEVLEE